jgi:hypothetical protein
VGHGGIIPISKTISKLHLHIKSGGQMSSQSHVVWWYREVNCEVVGMCVEAAPVLGAESMDFQKITCSTVLPLLCDCYNGNIFWWVGVLIHVFLTSALVGAEWLPSHLSEFILREKSRGTYWIGSWVGPIAGLDVMEKRQFLTLSGPELWPLSPAHSQLYRLCYPAVNNEAIFCSSLLLLSALKIFGSICLCAC